MIIIEDEPLVAMDLESTLRAPGCEVVGSAGTLDKARLLISHAQYDAALVDVNLSGHPVDELAAALTQKNIPFAFVTGYGRDGVPRGFRDAVLFKKPFSQDQLLAVMEQLISRPAPSCSCGRKTARSPQAQLQRARLGLPPEAHGRLHAPAVGTELGRATNQAGRRFWAVPIWRRRRLGLRLAAANVLERAPRPCGAPHDVPPQWRGLCSWPPCAATPHGQPVGRLARTPEDIRRPVRCKIHGCSRAALSPVLLLNRRRAIAFRELEKRMAGSAGAAAKTPKIYVRALTAGTHRGHSPRAFTRALNDGPQPGASVGMLARWSRQNRAASSVRSPRVTRARASGSCVQDFMRQCAATERGRAGMRQCGPRRLRVSLIGLFLNSGRLSQ